jgi:hypothetical protein
MPKNSFAIDYDTEIGEIIINVSAFNQKTCAGINCFGTIFAKSCGAYVKKTVSLSLNSHSNKSRILHQNSSYFMNFK